MVPGNGDVLDGGIKAYQSKPRRVRWAGGREWISTAEPDNIGPYPTPAPFMHTLNPLNLQWPTRDQDAELARADGGEIVLALEQQIQGAGQAAAHRLMKIDNLDGLKWVLGQEDQERPRLILIDPPYNTDKRFFYRDRQGTTRSDRMGRRAAWLGFMLPRLILAQRWLAEDGIILVHIDEHEAHYLQVLMTEVFGADNDLGVLVWDKRNPKGDASGISVQHETIVAFAKNKPELKKIRKFARVKPAAQAFLDKASALVKQVGTYRVPADLVEAVKKYDLPIDTASFKTLYTLDQARLDFHAWSQDQDVPQGLKAYRYLDDQGEVYRTVSMAWPNKKTAPDDYFIPLLHPQTQKPCPVPARGWRNPPATMKRLADRGDIVFGSDETKQPERKYLLRNNMKENLASVIYYGGSDDALLKKMGVPFDTPKPVGLTKQLIQAFLGDQGGLVCDFFAGSGTVGHAAMELAREGFPVRSLLMQWPEPLENTPAQRAGYLYCKKHDLPCHVFSLTRQRMLLAANMTGQPLQVWSSDPAASGAA